MELKLNAPYQSVGVSSFSLGKNCGNRVDLVLNAK